MRKVLPTENMNRMNNSFIVESAIFIRDITDFGIK